MMRAGRYYVGDLCYVMHPQWREVCDLMFNTGANGNPGSVLDGEFNLANGVRFAVQGTAWGDGVYYDEAGREYPVDAGLIGCIAVEDVYDPEWFLAGVHEIEFRRPFVIDYVDGVIQFKEFMGGRHGETNVVLSIDTAPEYNDEDTADDEYAEE